MNRGQRACSASNEPHINYGTTDRPDASGRVACPACGKTVQLRARWGVVGTRSVIPTHAAKATGSAS
jgi:hypothetical protein